MGTRRIEFNWAAAGLGLAKSVVGLGLGPMAGALDGFSLAESEVNTINGQIKLWLNRALSDAMLEIFAEAQIETVSELPTHVEEAPLEVGYLPEIFLADPWTLEVWPVAGEPILTALTDVGIERQRALELCGNLADRFILRLRDNWRIMNLDGDNVRARLSTVGLDEACAIADAWIRDRETMIWWPKNRSNNAIFEKEFPVSKIYVPLRGFEVIDQNESGFDWDAMEIRKKIRNKPSARIVDLMDEMKMWLNTPEESGVLRFISGGPGSGKSTFSRMLAATIAADPLWRVRYVQLHRLGRSDIWERLMGEGDLRVQKMMEQALSSRRVLLVLDGLDELSTLGASGRDRALTMVSRLESIIQGQNDQNRWLRAVVLGRDLAVQRISSEVTDEAKILHVQPLTAHRNFLEAFDWKGDVPNGDLLSEWWAKVGSFGFEIPIIPSGSESEYAVEELFSSPVTNALLALFFKRKWGWMLESEMDIILRDLDKATLYYEIIKGIHERQWGVLRGTQLNALTNFGSFLIFLEDVALACFRDDTRTASLVAVEASLTDPEVIIGLRPTLIKSDSLPDQALMAFHVRLVAIEGEQRLEFTHKSFSDYLLARRILRAAWASSSLDDWLQRFGSFQLEMPVIMFMRSEASRQRAVDEKNLRIAHSNLSSLLSIAVDTGFPLGCFSECDNLPETSLINQHVANAELAIVAALDAVCRSLDDHLEIVHATVEWLDVWAAWRLIARHPPIWSDLPDIVERDENSDVFRQCLGRVLYKPHDDVTALKNNVTSDPDREGVDYFIFNLNRVDLRGADLHGAALVGARLVGANLRGSDLDTADLSSANLTGANLRAASLRSSRLRGAQLQRAHLRSANLCESDIRGASLMGANLVGAEIIGANIRRADLRGANLTGAKLERSDLQRSDFRGASLSSAVLHRVDLRRANLSGTNLKRSSLLRANLRGASLNGADISNADFRGVKGLDRVKFCSARNSEDAILTPQQRASLGLAPRPQDCEICNEYRA